ncbi:uncharacterized protein LOC129240474 [Anastrepha obliqua]|uniref:uncharacterized protein LOC129240474 n=1 Tax=Anastrepha obliqua TaxID=95512 RepID=UPI00240A0DD3|nr:uncharacterized protein LOC129240474 [Anastrepha obliqua]
MTCNCVACKREVQAGNKPVHDKQVHWAPRDASQNILRQRDELRGSREEAEGAPGSLSGTERGDSPIRRRRRIHLRLHTSEGTPLRRPVGSSSEVGQTSAGARRRQRAVNRRRKRNASRRSRSGTEFPTARTTQQRPQRRRGANAGASTNRLPLASFATGEGTRQPQPLLREMAACLLSQATILARVVEELPSGASAAQQMGAPAAQRPTRPTRRRPRRQRTSAALGARSSNRNHSRSGRQNSSRRHHH